jgi:hypothetical protein
MRSLQLKQWMKVALVFLPVVLWDIFYFLLKELYNICEDVDEIGGQKLDKFINGE